MDELVALRIILRLENALHGIEEALATKTVECAQAIARADQAEGELADLKAETPAT